jgi:pimeloyl-ACP methyl ester carboxylesterase
VDGQLVLVHGAGTDGSVWRRVRPRLAERFTVHVPARTGRGFAAEGRDLARFLAGLDGPVRLLGHSGGALVALEAALAFPAVVSLVLYEPPVLAGAPPYRPDGLLATMRDLLAAGSDGDAVLAFHRHTGMDDDRLARLPASDRWPRMVAGAAGLLSALESSVAYPPPTGRLAALRAPVLLVLGDRSPDMYAASVRHLRRWLPYTVKVTLHGQRHDAHVRAPDLFVDAVLPFLTVDREQLVDLY